MVRIQVFLLAFSALLYLSFGYPALDELKQNVIKPADNFKTNKDKRGLVDALGYGYGLHNHHNHEPSLLAVLDHNLHGLLNNHHFHEHQKPHEHVHTVTTITKEIPVLHPYPVSVEKHVPYPVKVPVAIPVPKPYPVAVDNPVSYHVDKHVPFQLQVPIPIPQSVYLEKPILVKDGDYHHHHHHSDYHGHQQYGTLDYYGGHN